MTAGPASRAEQHLTAAQQEMVRIWEQHMKAEFIDRDVDATMATITEDPVNIGIATGDAAAGAAAVREFYSEVFLRQIPADMEVVPISRTVGTDRIVDEVVGSFTHSIKMDWLLPGVPPTNRRVEHPVVIIVQFRDGKIAGERLYWDQASVLAQVGLLDPTAVPAVGADSARTLLQIAGAP